MTPYEFHQQMQRLAAIMPKAWDDTESSTQAKYLDEVRERFASLPYDEWREVMTIVIECHRDPRRPPLIATYRDALQLVRERARAVAARRPVAAPPTNREEDLAQARQLARDLSPTAARKVLHELEAYAARGGRVDHELMTIVLVRAGTGQTKQEA